MGFRNLPAFGDFLAVRATRLFQARQRFEAEMDKAHEATLRSWPEAMSPEDEVKKHLVYSKAAKEADGKEFLPEDEQDIRSMLGRRGVLPVPDEVTQWAADALKRKSVPFAEVLAAFRGSGARAEFGFRGAAPKRGQHAGGVDPKTPLRAAGADEGGTGAASSSSAAKVPAAEGTHEHAGDHGSAH